MESNVKPGTFRSEQRKQITAAHKAAAALKNFGATVQTRILIALSREPLNYTQLQHYIGFSGHPYFIRNLNELQKQGYIEKVVNGHINYKLTEAGSKEYKILKKQMRHIFSA